VLVATAVTVLAGPPVAAQWAGRTRVEALQQGPMVRLYRVYRPATLVPRPGLVINLHAARTSGFLEEMATRFDAQADRLQWIVAAGGHRPGRRQHGRRERRRAGHRVPTRTSGFRALHPRFGGRAGPRRGRWALRTPGRRARPMARAGRLRALGLGGRGGARDH